MINGTDALWLEKFSTFQRQTSPFSTVEQMTFWLQEFSAKQQIRLDPLCPAAGGSLADGKFRWHAMLRPIAIDGPLFSLRRHRFHRLKLRDFFDPNDLLQDILLHLDRNRPLIICGPTGSGKTSLMASLLSEIAERERIVCLEQVAEIPRLSPHWLSLVARGANGDGLGEYTLERMLQESLRLRPDRILIGEIRGAEAAVFLQILNIGHAGVLTTMHASSLMQAVRRLETLSHQDQVFEILKEEKVGLLFLKRGSRAVISQFVELGLPFEDCREKAFNNLTH